MYDLERDEYREKHYGRSGCFYWFVWLAWIVANVSAILVGWSVMGYADALLQPERGSRLLSLEGEIYQSDLPGYLAALAYGLGVGTLVGLAQGLVLTPFLKLRTASWWVLATAIGWTIRSLLLYLVSQQLVGLVVDRYIEGGCVLLALLLGMGCVAGFASGFPQTLIVQPRGDHPIWWLLANFTGPCAMAFLITLGLFVEGYNVFRTTSPVLIAIISSAVTGVTLMDLLRHPTTQAEWQPRLKWARERPSRQTEDTVLGSTLYGPVESSSASSEESGKNKPLF